MSFYALWTKLFCSENCQNKTCNQSNGHCLACNEARSGNLCESEQPAKCKNLSLLCGVKS